MQTVYKYPIELGGTAIVPLPSGAIILSAQVQFDQVCIWALVETEAPQSLRTIRIFGTGQSIEDDARLKFIDTVQLMGGKLIFHLFEEIGL